MDSITEYAKNNNIVIKKQFTGFIAQGLTMQQLSDLSELLNLRKDVCFVNIRQNTKENKFDLIFSRFCDLCDY